MGILQAEADRRARDERAREEAAERLKRPFADADINTIKDKIKANTGTRPRFNRQEHLLDISEFANTTDDIDSGGVLFCCQNDNLSIKRTRYSRCRLDLEIPGSS